MTLKNVIKTTAVAGLTVSALYVGFSYGIKETVNTYIPVIKNYDKEVKAYTEQVSNNEVLIDDLKTLVDLQSSKLDDPVVIEASALKYNKADNFVITAYSPYDDISGLNHDGDPNTTSTMTKPKPGTFAVDPKVIPYGSKVTIIYPDGTIERGVAEDTGGMIKNNRIDVFRWTYAGAMKFGRKKAVVLWEK